MAQKVTTFLMFECRAEEAMNFYISLFRNAKVVDVKRYGPGEAGAEGSVMHATFTLRFTSPATPRTRSTVCSRGCRRAGRS